MKYLISCNNALILYDLDKDQINNITRPTSGNNFCYGITWNNEKVFIAWREPDEITILDRDLKYTGRSYRSNKLSDIHQMLFANDFLFVSNAGMNNISIFNDNLELIKEWMPRREDEADDPGEEYSGGRYKHWNSIRVRDGKMYLLAHMYQNPPSKIWVLKLPEMILEKKICGGKMAHNIFWMNDKIAVLNSGGNGLLFPESNESFTMFNKKPWLRGISIVNDITCIGLSEECFDKNQRKNVGGGLFFMKDQDFMKMWIKPLGFGPVMEIRCLDEEDSCHDIAPLWR